MRSEFVCAAVIPGINTSIFRRNTIKVLCGRLMGGYVKLFRCWLQGIWAFNAGMPFHMVTRGGITIDSYRPEAIPLPSIR